MVAGTSNSDQGIGASAAASSSPILHAFIAARFDLAALLADPRFTPDEVLAFASDPAMQQQLADLARVAQAGLTIRAVQARQAAIEALESITKTTEDPVEKRRAAFALFRATASPLIPLYQASPHLPPPSHPPRSSDTSGADEKPARPPLDLDAPACPDAAPRAVARAAMRALADGNIGVPALSRCCLPRFWIGKRSVDATSAPDIEQAVAESHLAILSECGSFEPTCYSFFDRPDLYFMRWLCEGEPRSVGVNIRLRFAVYPGAPGPPEWLIETISADVRPIPTPIHNPN